MDDRLNQELEEAANTAFSGRDLAAELSEMGQEPDEGIGSPERRETAAFQGYQLSLDKDAVMAAETIPSEMKEWLNQLPDTLNFNEQVTLIVGKNGSGKTQFARAMAAVLTSDRDGADTRNHSFHLEDEEPAITIADAMNLSEQRPGNSISAMLEGAELMWGSRQWAQQEAQKSEHNQLETSPNHRLSSRELFNQSVNDVLQTRINGQRRRVFGESRPGSANTFSANPGEAVLIFDEPEMGLSPEGQLTLGEDLKGLLPESDILLVPTNNVVLARLCDFPRLDTEHPERGIHRPSEFDELLRLVKADGASETGQTAAEL